MRIARLISLVRDYGDVNLVAALFALAIPLNVTEIHLCYTFPGECATPLLHGLLSKDRSIHPARNGLFP